MEPLNLTTPFSALIELARRTDYHDQNYKRAFQDLNTDDQEVVAAVVHGLLDVVD